VYRVFALYSPCHTLSSPPTPSTASIPPRQDPFHPPVLPFCKGKKVSFLFKIATQEFSLWFFHIHMHYSLIWFISATFILYTLVPFLWWFQPVLKFCILSYIESSSTIFTFLSSFFPPPPLVYVSCFS
jgi:hypothetical protein